MSTSVSLENYKSYRGLPMLAGLATVAEAAKPGLSVAACVGRLKRYHYAFMRLHEILTARITAEPIYELKTGFAHHGGRGLAKCASRLWAWKKSRTRPWRFCLMKSWPRRQPQNCS